MRDDVVGDSGLWSRGVDGSGSAFGELFDIHHDRVFRHAYRLVENRHDAEDVTATAFLELWRRRADVRLVDGSVLPWLLVTTTNVARNVRRAARRYRQLLDALPRSENTMDPARIFLAAHPMDAFDPQLALGLRSLSAADLRLVSLVMLEGYTIAAAALVLGLTSSGAKTRLHRARLRLRVAMGETPIPSSRTIPEGGRP
ncbi:RNA polymerase sigma factor [Cryobacterium sp. Y29]|uniref:RNA polymerase sigma factor n=1 Tax=Cryobacterium sp. Y29 TaxID=2048285 RepID=UPI000CE35F5C|nr:sigma-70 family RNA polymerase sigma factor [Cryobacterium sp. Y29]